MAPTRRTATNTCKAKHMVTAKVQHKMGNSIWEWDLADATVKPVKQNPISSYLQLFLKKKNKNF
jgi:hypothetical protein